ncbi:MAG: hypothetical protein HW397_583 [Dehalococcoidia bacterium]|nr:hypothetical protein [Dehalococcoidia bacterium]
MSELVNPGRPVSASKLTQLADLTPDGVRIFSEAWPSIPPERRTDVIAKIVDLGEDNVELDFSALFRRLLDDEDADIRVKAIDGLWESQERPLIDPLVRLLRTDPEEAVRCAAAQALGRFALLAETGKLLPRDKERLASVLLAVIDGVEETVEVRRRAIEAISPLSMARVPEIIREAYESELPNLRASAIYAMGLTCNADWVDILLDEIDNDDPEMRYEAAVALGEIGNEETASKVGLLVDDPDPLVQAAALNALGNMGGELAKRLLTQAARNDDPRIAELADEALRSLDFEDEPQSFPGYSGRRR